MILLLLAGCFGTTSRPTCDTVEVEVADDDPLGDLDFTVGDLVAAVTGVRTFPATLVGDTVVAAEMVLARTEAPALFFDATLGVEETPRIGFGEASLDLMVMCEDAVSVPLELDLTTADGSVDIVAEVDAEADDIGEDPGPGVDRVAMRHTLDREVDVLPTRGDTPGELYVQLDGAALSRLQVYWDVPDDEGIVLQYPPVEAE